MLELLKRTLRAALVMVLHLLLATTVSACLKGSELVWGLLFHQQEPTVMGLFPFRWILEAGEAGITIVFIVFGLIEAVSVMRDKGAV